MKHDIQQIINHLDGIRTILAKQNSSKLADNLAQIVTIPDLFNDDRLTESVIYLEIELEQID